MAQSLSLQQQQKQKQTLKQNQRLMMSPQMQQAIQLLQMPVMELSAVIDMELQQNPVLEYMTEEAEGEEAIDLEETGKEESLDVEQPAEQELVIDDHDFEILKRLDEDFRDYFAESGTFERGRTREEERLKAFQESSICLDETLVERLMLQARDSFEDALELRMAEVIIGNLDEQGFFTMALEEVALVNDFDIGQLTAVLSEIQRFEPLGIAAIGLRESLLAQLKGIGKGATLAYEIVDKHFDDLIHNRIPVIQKGLSRSAQEIREAIDGDIVKLDLHPGTWHSSQVVQHIVPDITVRDDQGSLVIEVNDEAMPSIRLNRKYMKMLEDESLPVETKDYVRQKILSGKWLLRNIRQRNETLEKIVQSLTQKQREFFVAPEGNLVPLTMKVLAEELSLHESTIARAVANKYIDSPRGVVSLRSFFTNSYVTDEGKDISSTTVKDVLLDIIKNENKNKPLSDEAISKQIKERGIPCARRTVAKYRTLLNIGNASQRKNYG